MQRVYLSPAPPGMERSVPCSGSGWAGIRGPGARQGPRRHPADSLQVADLTVGGCGGQLPPNPAPKEREPARHPKATHPNQSAPRRAEDKQGHTNQVLLLAAGLEGHSFEPSALCPCLGPGDPTIYSASLPEIVSSSSQLPPAGVGREEPFLGGFRGYQPYCTLAGEQCGWYAPKLR